MTGKTPYSGHTGRLPNFTAGRLRRMKARAENQAQGPQTASASKKESPMAKKDRTPKPSKPELVHLTTGEIVVPPEVLTPALLEEMQRIYEFEGLDFARYIVGGPVRGPDNQSGDSVNPETGMREFFDSADDSVDDNDAAWSGLDDDEDGNVDSADDGNYPADNDENNTRADELASIAAIAAYNAENANLSASENGDDSRGDYGNDGGGDSGNEFFGDYEEEYITPDDYQKGLEAQYNYNSKNNIDGEDVALSGKGYDQPSDGGGDPEFDIENAKKAVNKALQNTTLELARKETIDKVTGGRRAPPIADKEGQGVDLPPEDQGPPKSDPPPNPADDRPENQQRQEQQKEVEEEEKDWEWAAFTAITWTVAPLAVLGAVASAPVAATAAVAVAALSALGLSRFGSTDGDDGV